MDLVERRTPRADFINRPTAAILDRDHAQAWIADRVLSAKSAWRFPAIRIAFMRWSKPKTAACSAPTTPGATWTTHQRRSPHPPARVLLLAHLRRPERQRHGYVLNTAFLQIDRRRKNVQACFVRLMAINHDLWIASNDPKRMVNSNDGGANVSVNGGETWTGREFPTAQLYHVATTLDVPYHVCGAQQDNRPSAFRARCRPRRRHHRLGVCVGRPAVFAGRRRKRLHRAASGECRTSFTPAARARC